MLTCVHIVQKCVVNNVLKGKLLILKKKKKKFQIKKYNFSFRWLDQKSECPHCRAHLRSQKLVPCRFVSEITHVNIINNKNNKKK
jgi:hypothetical protein